MKKKLILLVLALLLVIFSAMAFSACNEEEKPDDGDKTEDTQKPTVDSDDECNGTNSTATFIYTINADGNGYIIDGTTVIIKNDIIVPSKINGLPVTEIGANFLTGKTTITSVKIPNSVTSIGNDAFRGCTGLTSVTIPNSVESIGSSAFEDCTGLTEINFNATAMNDLSSSNYVFSYAGQSGSGITVNIGANVTKIPAYLFYPYDGYIISYTPKITSVVFAENSQCTSIGAWAFYWCTGLTSISIPNSVTSIGDYAFNGCHKLVEVYNLSSSITVTKGSWSNGYVGCYALDVYTDANAESKLSNVNGYILYNNGTDRYLLGYTGNDTKLTLPENIGGENYSIYKYAFYYNDKITSVIITNSVTSIGSYAFRGCTGLKSIVIPNSVTSIGYDAFYGCTGLESIVIPNSVTNIGSSAFEYCTGLTSVTIGNGVTSIDKYAFEGCTGLKSINYNGTKAQWNAISRGYNWNSATGKYTIYCTDGNITKY